MMKVPRVDVRPGKGLSLWSDCSAVAAVEMALVLPVIGYIVLNIADLAIYAYSRMQVDLAAQEAVGAARVLCNTSTANRQLPAKQNCVGLDAAIVDASRSTSLGSSVVLSGGTNDHSIEGYYCADSTSTLQSVGAYNASNIPATCSGVYPGSTVAPGDYISVTANYAFAPVFPGATVASLLTTPITKTAWLRLN